MPGWLFGSSHGPPSPRKGQLSEPLELKEPFLLTRTHDNESTENYIHEETITILSTQELLYSKSHWKISIWKTHKCY